MNEETTRARRTADNMMRHPIVDGSELLALHHSADGQYRWSFCDPCRKGTGNEDWPIRLASSTRGRHAVAAKQIAAGTCLFVDEAIAKSMDESFAKRACHTCYMPIDGASVVCANCKSVWFCSDAEGEASVDCLVLCSYFSHSCAPSAVVSRIGRTLRLHAIRDLAPGEEVSISYLTDLCATREARHASLTASRGFACECSRCVDPPGSDYLLDGWACSATECKTGVVRPHAVGCETCGKPHALPPDTRAAMELRWSNEVESLWRVLPAGGHTQMGKSMHKAAYATLPKVDRLLSTSSGRLCDSHALRQRALALRAYAVGACTNAPPAALVEAVQDCLRGMHSHLHPASPKFCSFLHRLARALERQAAAMPVKDADAAAALRRRAGATAQAAAQGLSIGWGSDHPVVQEWRALAASLEPAAPPQAAVWEPPTDFDEHAFLVAHWPGWEFAPARVAAFRHQVQLLNRQMGKPKAEAYQGGLRLKIRTPPFFVLEKDWGRLLVDVVDVPGVQQLVAECVARGAEPRPPPLPLPPLLLLLLPLPPPLLLLLAHPLPSGSLTTEARPWNLAGISLLRSLRAHHGTILAEYNAVSDAYLSDEATKMLTGGRLWVEAFPQQMPTLQRILSHHRRILSPRSDSLSSGSISILRPGAVSKVHTGQFNMRLRLHYPLDVPAAGPELAGAEQSFGNPWAKGAFLIDDAQLHAVRNTGDQKRSIVLCDILRRDLPRLPPEMLSKLG